MKTAKGHEDTQESAIPLPACGGGDLAIVQGMDS